MPNYRRYYIANAIVFITVVTRNRIPYFNPPEDVTHFFNILERVQQLHPYHLLAYVLLPDHFHCLMTVENAKDNFSIVLNSIKRNYTKNYKTVHQISTSLNLWQDRFWDHIIRNEPDLKNHLDYIHWNPVKHGYVESPKEWKYSTYQFWYEQGFYPTCWSNPNTPSSILDMNFE